MTMDPSTATDTQPFLNAATAIAGRLVQTAQWTGDAATWTVMQPDRENPGTRRAVPALASGTVYEGTAGIALFLAEMYAVRGGEDLLRTALGAIRTSLDTGATLPENSFGFHSGRPGIAWAAVRVGELTGHPELFAEAEALLRPLAGKEAHDTGLDVIAGGGGALPALLQIAGRVDRDLVMGMAVAIGEHMIQTATRDADGWSWATMRNSSVRNLNGYAHGAAGIGHGLLELYAATGDGRFRYGAEQAFLYERRFFNETECNWPDLRHSELGEYQFEGRLEELRDLLRAGGTLPVHEGKYMSAWCHGAPGIGLSRVRAWQLLGDPLYLAEARAAFTNVERSLASEMAGNYSYCHGRGGNAETLVYGAAVLNEPALLEPARAAALTGIARHESEGGTPWPCGTMGAVSDPGLLLGESGIGMFLLRLAHPEVPTPLLVTAPDATAAAAEGGRAGAEGYAEMRERSVREHFGDTLRAWTALGVDVDAVLPHEPMGAAPVRSDVERAYDALAAYAASAGEQSELLEDAFLVDRTRYELAATVTDFTREYTDALARLAPDEVEWSEGRLELSARARVVATRWDWDPWLDGDASGAPEEDEVYFLIQFTNGAVQVRKLSPFAAVVLQRVREPSTVDEVVETVAAAVSGGAGEVDRGWLQTRVMEQVGQAYRAGFLGVQRELAPAA
ncbi:hypothetical protein FHS01_002460 [Longimicrobium terrae]|uniref:Uncharacterized protein n=2 Tax=Longimicrobium terrae TaxID=1639882 RepID=A0A841GZ11_9BACT|nr:lanthionine synthetase LanC family protein [Longimicrobium terrae]MBB4636441.1 hypothetical protein [Longimicrobium terrae]MBB6071035.1 hypothetical protein [Longimicrobium terrae]